MKLVLVVAVALIDRDGVSHRMAGLLGLVTSHAQRRLHLGYRRALLAAPIGALAPDTELAGHEFRYATIVAQPDAPLARVQDAEGADLPDAGSHRARVTGTFFHLIAAT